MLTATLRLDALGSGETYGAMADRVLTRRARAIRDNPGAFSGLIGVVDRWVRGPTHIVLVNPYDDQAIASLADVARETYVPNRMLARAHDERAAGLPATPSEPGAYVCRNRTCSPVIREADSLRAALEAP